MTATMEGTPVTADSWTFDVMANNQGSLRIQAFTLTVEMVDADGNGMDDQWEADHGLDPAFDGPFDDHDNDGYCNLREFLSGSHPADEQSLPAPIADSDGDGDVDGQEMQLFGQALAASPSCQVGFPCQFDFNGDDEVDDIDLNLFAEDYGRDTTAAK